MRRALVLLVLALLPGSRLIAGTAAASVTPASSMDDVEPIAGRWIDDRGAADLEQALLLSSSVWRNDAGLFIDGIQSQRWLVEVDGLRLLREPRGDLVPALLPLPLFLTEAVKLHPGPQPGLPGLGALGGRIAVENRPSASDFEGRAAMSLGLGAASLSRLSLATAARSGRIRAQLASGVDGAGLLPQLDSQGGTTSLRSRVSAELDPRARMSLTTLTSRAMGPALELSRQAWLLDTDVALLPGQTLRFRLARQSLAETARDRSHREQAAETSAELAYRGELVQRHLLRVVLRGQVTDASLREGALQSSRGHRSGLGLVLEDAWKIRDNLHFEGTVDLEVDDLVGPMLGGRAALRYQPARALVLRGSIGTSQRAPGLAERQDSPRGAPSLPSLSSGTLQAEQAQGLRLSVGYEPSPALWARVAYFQTEVDQLIVPRPVDPSGAAGYRNGGRLHVQGLGLDLRTAQLRGGLGLELSYRWIFDAVDDWYQSELPERRGHRARLRLTWDLTALGTQLYSDVELRAGGAAAVLPDTDPLRVGVHAGLRQHLFGRLLLLVSVDDAIASRDPQRPEQRTLRVGLLAGLPGIPQP